LRSLADITQRDPDFDKATRYDKLLFAARECFLNGLVKGFSLYRDAIKMEAGEPV
jgi:hypothetical protein